MDNDYLDKYFAAAYSTTVLNRPSVSAKSKSIKITDKSSAIMPQIKNALGSTEKKKKTKKKKKRKSVMNEEITQRLVNRWKQNGLEDNQLMGLFKRVDNAFDDRSEANRGYATINTAPYPGKCQPDPIDSATMTDVLRWIDLREHYLIQLKDLFAIVSENNMDNMDEAKASQLVLLLGALRKITIRIVSVFENVCLSYNKKKSKHVEDNSNLVRVTNYIRSLASSVDWFASFPYICENIIHVNPILNPFLSTQRIDGKPAVFSSLVDPIPFELTLDAGELELCSHLGFIVYTLHTSSTQPRDAMSSSMTTGLNETKHSLTDYYNYTNDTNTSIDMSRVNNDTDLNSPTYFLNNNEFDTSSVSGKSHGNGNQTISELRKQHVHFHPKKSAALAEVNGSYDVRYATTNIGDHRHSDASGGKKLLYSNSTPFISSESPIRFDNHHRDESVIRQHHPSLHQKVGADEWTNDDVVVRRVGGRLSNNSSRTSTPPITSSVRHELPPISKRNKHEYVTDNDILAERVVETYKLRMAWKYWRREYLERMKIFPMKEYRRRRILQMVFNQFRLCLWQNFLFRDLINRYHLRLKRLVFKDGFVKHHLWCQNLKIFYSDILRKLLRKYFDFLRIWVNNTNANRSFVKNRRLRFIKSGFRCFRSNVLLNRHLLQVKLRNSSSLTFCDYFARQVCYFKWTKFKIFAKKLDLVDELVENVLMKDALVRWVLMTWPPKPKLTIKQRCMQLRDVIEKNLLSACNQTIVTMTPLVLAIQKEVQNSSQLVRTSVSTRYDGLLMELRPKLRSLLSNGQNQEVNPVEEARKQEQVRKELLRKSRIHNAIKYANELANPAVADDAVDANV